VEPDLAKLSHANLRELLGAFALGAVDAEEAEVLRAHLTTCAECQAELAELWAAVDAMADLVEPMEPPPALRERIAAAVQADGRGGVVEPPPAAAPRAPETLRPPEPVRRPEPVPPSEPVRAAEPIQPPATWWSRATPWAAAAAILLLLSAGLLIWNLRLREELTATTPLTIALAPTDAAPGASGEVHYQPESQLFVVDVRDLPPLAAGHVYEVWLIGAEGPRPAGVFDQPTAEHAIIADRSQYQTIAITAEPGPLGTAAPTGEIVATATL
jgi:anti-sigma-K factor RskA